jgi:hypothetical protein
MLMQRLTIPFALYERREVRPLLDLEGVDDAHALSEPRQIPQRIDRGEQVREIVIGRDVEAALND